MKKAIKADLLLFLVTLFWGAGFPITKFALATITPFYHIGFRFFIASILLSIIFHRKLKGLKKDIMMPSFILSVFLFACYALQTIGLQYTTASKSGFFSGLSVLFVPVISIFYLKARLKKNTLIGILMATLGLLLLSYSGDMFSFNIGDFITIISTICYAWQLLFTGNFVKKHDATLLAIVQLFFVSVYGFIGAFIFEPIPSQISILSFNSLLFSAVLCTAFAFWVQTTIQQYTSASHIALVITMEPVFGALTSYLFLGEILGFKGIMGGICIVGAMIVTEIQLPDSLSNMFRIGSKQKRNLSS
ncbi:MAG: DMT family transporter [Bacillota bacterium]